MSIQNSNTRGRPRWRQTEQIPFRPTLVALAVAGAVLMAEQPAAAASKNNSSVKALKAEVARLQRALEQSQRALAAQKANADPSVEAPAGEAPAGEAPAAEQATGEEAPPEPTAEAAKDEPKALGEVVVRTRRGLRQKHDEAKSVSVVTGAELQQTGAYNLADFTKRTANLARDTGNPRTFSLSIRGLGRKGITEAQDPVVMTSIDGISYAYNSLAAWDQVDVESVEVYRGPGGTTGGKNYSLGNVNITTRGPSFTSGGRYAMRFGQYDTMYGDLAYGGPLIDNLLAWRGTFFVHKADGPYPNEYGNTDRSLISTNQISGKLQFLLTPTEDFTAKFRVDVEPRTYQNFNGLNFYHKEPATYTNGNGWNHSATAFNRLNRGWFGQLPDYGLTGNRYNYYNFNTGTQYNDSQKPLGTKMQGYNTELNWKVWDHTLTSITDYRQFWFDANNDEGTPYDITLQSGGGVNYRQFSQELRLSSQKGGLVDYVTGLYYIKTATNVDAKNGWGSDAGFWFAGGTPTLFTDPLGGTQVSGVIKGPAYTHTQIDPITGRTGLVYGGAYGRLTADGAGRALASDSLNNLRTLGQQIIRNQSPAWYGNANWHITDDLTLTTGLRTTYEDRATTGYRIITNNGNAALLNPTKTSFGLNLGGFDSINVSAPTGLTGGGYNAIGPDGQWRSYNYNKTFDPATDVNTYVVNNKIVDKQTWVKAGKPVTATSYATNDGFYTNGRKLGLGTNVASATTAQKVGTTNATKAAVPVGDIIRVQVGTTALTTDKENYLQALKQANAAALKYFGRRTTTDPNTGVTTQAWDQLTAAQQRQIADAQNIRKAQIGPVYGATVAEPFRKVQLQSVLSPTYKINEDLNVYASWQHGESAGISQIVNGVSMQAKPQITNSYEIGLKSFLFERTLTLNTDVFFMGIDDYQQAVQVLDSYTTDLMNDGNLYWTTATLNAKKVKAWGIEVDGTYTGIPNTALRFAAAYNDAWYADFKNSPLPPEIDPNSPQYKDNPYRDVSGMNLPGASRFMFNVGGEYRQPIPSFESFVGHTALNYSFQTGYNADVTLSKYGWVNGFGLVDFSLGLGRKDNLFDVSLLVRNLLDTRPVAAQSAAGVLQTAPRWIGVVVSGQF